MHFPGNPCTQNVVVIYHPHCPFEEGRSTCGWCRRHRRSTHIRCTGKPPDTILLNFDMFTPPPNLQHSLKWTTKALLRDSNPSSTSVGTNTTCPSLWVRLQIRMHRLRSYSVESRTSQPWSGGAVMSDNCSSTSYVRISLRNIRIRKDRASQFDHVQNANCNWKNHIL